MLVASSSGSSSILIIYVIVFGALYFFYLRPRSRRQKAQRLEGKKVAVGQRAQTIGGFVGTVVSNDGEFITLQSASGVVLDFVPAAIARRYDPEVPESRDDHVEDEHPSEGDAQ